MVAGLVCACSPAPPGGAGEPTASIARSEVRGALDLALPSTPRDATRITDRASQIGVSFQLVGTRLGKPERSGDTTRFVGAGPDGGDVWHRVTRFGIEDDTEIRAAGTLQLEYRIELEAVAGLRLVAGVLELLATDGTPRVRVGPAFVKDATGRTVSADLALTGCNADRDPRGPWGREVVPPGASSCRLSVSWQAGLSYPIVVDPPWSSPVAMVAKRFDHTATSLATGQVLATGGTNFSTFLTSAELYDPATKTWSATGSMQQARYQHHALQLQDGRVFVIGSGGTTEIYDPTSGTFSAGGSLLVSRSEYSASLVGNGNVLIAGGDSGILDLETCELFDPTTNAFTTTGSMSIARRQHAAVTLADGSVLVVGSKGIGTAERYSPQSGSWSIAGSPTYAPQDAGRMVLLQDGRALLTGGHIAGMGFQYASLYNPAQNTWAQSGSMPGSLGPGVSGDCCTPKTTPGCDTPSVESKVCGSSPGCCSTAWDNGCVNAVSGGVNALPCGKRQEHDMLTLTDGRVLVATGRYAGDVLTALPDPGTPLLYFPTPSGLGSWIVTSDPIENREDGALAPLPDGNALLVGGSSVDASSRETCFTQGCVCVLNQECFSNHCVDGYCCDTACSGTCEACSAPLKGSGANGTCGSIAASTDPQNECVEADPTICTTDGFCDGAGACRLYSNGTKCGPSSCIDTVSENHPSLCDGSGVCVEKGSGTCPGGYVCTGDACLTSCVTGSECQEHYLCVNGSCKRLPNGQPCSQNVECESDQCVDGVCCNDACDGQCEACDVKDHVGDCSPVTGEPHGDRPACESTGNGDCASTCNGADPTACKLPGKEKTCGDGKSCDGKGTCVQTAAICSADKTQSTALDGTVTKCGLYACDTSTGACGTSCSTSSQCAPTAVCDQPTCIASSEGEADEGCGCDLAPSDAGRGAVVGLVLALGLWLRRRRSRVVLLAAALVGCSPTGKDEAPAPGESVDRSIAELSSRFPSAGLLEEDVPDLLGRAPARVTLGRGFEVEDGDTHVAVSVELVGEDATRPRVNHGSHWLGRGRGPEGSDVLLRVNDRGVEDFVVFERAPAQSVLEYRIDVSRVPGLRFVEGVLELLDQKGYPRLAVNRPWTIDGKGVRRDADLELVGCDADRDPRVPFDRPVTPPNAKSCRLVVKFARDVSYPLLVDPSWTNTTSPGTASYHASAVLADGRLLICGGPGNGTRIYTNGVFTITGTMSQLRQGHTATRLDSGLVLAAGGNSNTAEVYDVATGTWSPVGSMASSRVFGRATKLGDGSVLITGGDSAGTAEQFVPATNSFQPAGSLGSPRIGHTATLLADGRVLVAGGGTSAQPLGDTTAISYTPGTGWAATGNLNVARGNHVAARLGDGRVLVAGGEDIPGAPGWITDAEIWNPTAGTWAVTTPLPSGKRNARAVAFGNGTKVYVIGGRNGGLSTYIFDVATSTWSDGGSLYLDRWTHTADLLPNGVLMVVGKFPQSGETNPPAELQCVDYGCACSAAVPCLVGSCVDGVCCQTACNGVCEACNAAGKATGPDGECGPALNGTADPGCKVEAASTCGTIGTCDPAGACKKHLFGTECAPAACTGSNQLQAAASCDGNGACVVPQLATCEPGYPCTGDACATSCATNDDCILPYTCNGNVCQKKPNGAACGALGECASGFCVDGKCCNEACTGQCQSCAETGLEGVCTAVAGEPKGDRDPCDGAGTECAGTCETKSPQKCTYPTVSCGDGKTCSNGKCVSTANICVDGDTASQPASGPKTPCAPYFCADGECQTNCTTSQECVEGYVCDAKLCIPAEPPATGAEEDDGGCGCRTSRGDSSAWALVMAGLCLGMLRRRKL